MGGGLKLFFKKQSPKIFYVSTKKGCDKFFRNFTRFSTKLSQISLHKKLANSMSLNDGGLVAKEVVNSPIMNLLYFYNILSWYNILSPINGQNMNISQ